MVQDKLFDAFLRDVARCTPAKTTLCELRGLARLAGVGPGQTVALDLRGNAVVYIGEGATKLIARASGGREQIVAFHFAGDLVSIPANAWHSYDLCALDKVQLLVFPAESFITTTNSDPAFISVLLERSLIALHRCRDKAVGLGRKNAQERLASFLVGMAERIGKGADCDANSSRMVELDLPMSRRDIGDSLGLTIETISRQFSDLRKSGLVETIGRSRVILCDRAELALRAGHV